MSPARFSRTRFGRLAVTLIARAAHLIISAGNTYRPELHYMRGPGPKWRAKHAGRISAA